MQDIFTDIMKKMQALASRISKLETWEPSGTTDAAAIHDNIASEISAIAEKASPVAADLLIIEDSAAANIKKRLQVGNLPPDANAIHGNTAAEISAITLKATPVTNDLLLIEDSAAGNAKKRVTIGTLPVTDTTAIHDNVAAEISAVTLKATPVTNDLLLIEDSAAANAKKRVTIGTLPVTDTSAIHDNVAAEISAITNKATPVGADLLLIEDSAAGNAKKYITITALLSLVSSSNIGARVYKDADQSINSGSWTAIQFNQERWDTDTIHDNVTNNTRLTCTTAGVYVITGSVSMQSNAAALKGIRIILNGATVIAEESTTAADTDVFTRTITTIYNLSATDYVELQVYHNTGVARNALYLANYSPEFMMHKIG